MKKKKPNLFFKILAILFLIYVAITIAYESGYYETKASNKAIILAAPLAGSKCFFCFVTFSSSFFLSFFTITI